MNQELGNIFSERSNATFNKQKKKNRKCLQGFVNDKLNDLVDGTDYNIFYSNGQRIYSAPGATESPIKGCEVFIGKIPRYVFEYEIIPVFERCGKIYQFRLMMDFSGYNRGYGFLSYTTPEAADKAVKILNNYPIRNGRRIVVYKSVDNRRLFLGGVPQNKSEDDIKTALAYLVDGIEKIIIYPSHQDKTKNRGFVFVEFQNHKLAAMARKKLYPGSFELWGEQVVVDWADPIPEVEPDVINKIDKLYMRNLPIDLTRDQLFLELTKYIPTDNIIKTYKSFDYAFIHFISREAAEESLELLEGFAIDGEPIEVTWARPQTYSKNYRENNPPTHLCTSLPPKIRKHVYNARQLAREKNSPQILRSPSYSCISNSNSSNYSDGQSPIGSLSPPRALTKRMETSMPSNYCPLPHFFQNERAINFNNNYISSDCSESSYNFTPRSYMPQLLANPYTTNIVPRQFFNGQIIF